LKMINMKEHQYLKNRIQIDQNRLKIFDLNIEKSSLMKENK